MLQTPNKKKHRKDLSLYIHIPFCRTICVYCGFLTYANKANLIDAYIKTLLSEISLKAPQHRHNQIVSIYFGGGTPSIIEAQKIKAIIDSIKNNYYMANNVEITIECNPESVTASKLINYKQYGVNRISLGVQSLNQKTLWRVARPHKKKDVKKTLHLLKKTGFKNFGTDFIIGLPFQTLNSFKKDIQEILAFKPPHLSSYFLSYDTKKIDLIAGDCPSEDEQIKMYDWLTGILKKRGYKHYEVSNFALPGFECKHNLRYWHQQEYLGFGLGAHSFINNTCMINEENLEKYLNSPNSTTQRFPLDQELQKLDYIMLMLRTSNGINLKNYKKKYKDIATLKTKAKPYLSSGLLKQNKNRLFATEKGFLLLDLITKDLL